MNQKGISLVELLVVMAITAIIGGVVFYTFMNMNRTVIDQNTVLDVQSEGRNAMTFMVRVLREAGLDPIGIADAGVEEAGLTNLRITRDSNLNGLIDDDSRERVSFSFNSVTGILSRGYDEDQASESWSEMCDNVAALSFSYLDNDGTDLGVPGTDPTELVKIGTIVISMSLQDDKVGGGAFSRTLTTSVRCRNL